MKAPLIALGFAALVSLPFLGCSSADATDPSSTGSEADVEDLDGKADGVSKPIGTYELSKPSTMGSKDLTLLVLKTDKTFHAEKQVVCVTYPCDPIGFDGVYKLTKSTTSSKRYIRLDDGNGITRYEYKLTSGGKLSIRLDGTTPWAEMLHADEAWCSEPAECLIQNIPQPKCPGKWQCNDNTCSFSECGGENACELAGGSCVGLTPTNCQDGTVGDANEYSCGGMLGVMCCLPKPQAPTCQYVGTADEGWYHADGTKICTADCGGTAAKCGAIGSKSEGWYAAEGQGCGGGKLIGWDKCGGTVAECTTDADCRAEADYCTGCDCLALSTNESVPYCPGPGVKCFADPCTAKAAACVGGQCVLE